MRGSSYFKQKVLTRQSEKHLSLSAGQSSSSYLFLPVHDEAEVLHKTLCTCTRYKETTEGNFTEYSNGTVCCSFAFIPFFVVVVPGFFVAFLRTRGVCRQLPSLFYRKVHTHLESPHLQHILCQWCKSKHLLCAFSIAHERLWSIRGWYALIVLFRHFFDPALWWYMWRRIVVSEKF